MMMNSCLCFLHSAQYFRVLLYEVIITLMNVSKLAKAFGNFDGEDKILKNFLSWEDASSLDFCKLCGSITWEINLIWLCKIFFLWK